MFEISIETSYGEYTVIFLKGAPEEREQFYNLCYNHSRALKMTLLDYADNISYFLMPSLEEFKEVLIRARTIFLEGRNKGLRSAAFIQDAAQVAQTIIDQAPRVKWLVSPQEIAPYYYKYHES